MTVPGMPLFARHPLLSGLPRVALGVFPTPVTRCDAIAEAAGAHRLWVKRDDLSAVAYGGNKVRKLEFLLGEALAAGATDVITFGAAGSNHSLATAVHGTAHGLRVHSMLMPQHAASYVARNLRASLAAGADLHLFEDPGAAVRGAVRLRAALRRDTGREPFVIPFGGTTPASTVGFVNAAFELAAQVEAGELPVPDLLYVTLGSMGTAAGLALGLRAAGLPTRIVAVQVIVDGESDAHDLLELITATQALLHGSDHTFPLTDWTVDDFDVVPGFVGEGYAVPTPEGGAAIALAAESADVMLDGTYTGKALAALLSRGRRGAHAARDVVFWNTYNSRDITPLVEQGDPACLPEALRAYLTETDTRTHDRGPLSC